MEKVIKLERSMGVKMDIDGDMLILKYNDDGQARDLLFTPTKSVSGLDDVCWIKVTKNKTLGIRRLD